MGTIIIDKKQFSVEFEFTTFHRGGRITGRTGTLGLETENCTVEDLWQDEKTIMQLCVNYVLSQNPKWKILLLKLKSIAEIKKVKEIKAT